MQRIQKNLVVCIPTANRSKLIFKCLESIQKGTILPRKILVLDMSSEKIYAELLSLLSCLDETARSMIELIHLKSSLPPSAARYRLSQEANSEFILYLDDDMAVEPTSIETLIDVMSQHPEAEILGCGVYEYGNWRDIGFRFDIGVSDEGDRFVSKKSIRKEWMDLQFVKLLKVDLITQPPFLIRKNVLDKVNFDSNYKWSHEIFDFFFSCYRVGISSHVTTDTFVNHFPGQYAAKTVKDDKMKFNLEGKKYFETKWGLSPIKELRRNFFIELFFQIVWRINKKKMVKTKIEKDGVKYNKNP